MDVVGGSAGDRFDRQPQFREAVAHDRVAVAGSPLPYLLRLRAVPHADSPQRVIAECLEHTQERLVGGSQTDEMSSLGSLPLGSE